jgi:hypothetical protein
MGFDRATRTLIIRLLARNTGRCAPHPPIAAWLLHKLRRMSIFVAPGGCLIGNENIVYVFLFWELRGLSPNFHIHMSVSDL